GRADGAPGDAVRRPRQQWLGDDAGGRGAAGDDRAAGGQCAHRHLPPALRHGWRAGRRRSGRAAARTAGKPPWRAGGPALPRLGAAAQGPLERQQVCKTRGEGPMSAVFERLRQKLEEAGVPFTVSRHAPVYTSEEAAAVRGTPLASGAKALVVKAGEA